MNVSMYMYWCLIADEPIGAAVTLHNKQHFLGYCFHVDMCDCTVTVVMVQVMHHI